MLSDKNLLKNESPPWKQVNCESSALRNRNVVKPSPASPLSMTKSPKDGNKLLSKAVSSQVAVFKLPMTWSDQRIVWNGLPKTIQLLGKV